MNYNCVYCDTANKNAFDKYIMSETHKKNLEKIMKRHDKKIEHMKKIDISRRGKFFRF